MAKSSRRFSNRPVSHSGGLIEGEDHLLYGVTGTGGQNAKGTVFKVQRDGTGFQLLHQFAANGSQGGIPQATLVEDADGVLYGGNTAFGALGGGTVFRLNKDGTAFGVIHHFRSGTADGNQMQGELVAGNSASTTFTVTRAPLQFTGFNAPISGADATGGSFAAPVRTFKAGSTIPVKFSATLGGARLTTGIHRLQAIKYSDATTAGTPIDATPQDAATTGDQFRLSGQDWQFNLDTKSTGLDTGIWQLVATLSDGSQHAVWVQIK